MFLTAEATEEGQHKEQCGLNEASSTRQLPRRGILLFPAAAAKKRRHLDLFLDYYSFFLSPRNVRTFFPYQFRNKQDVKKYCKKSPLQLGGIYNLRDLREKRRKQFLFHSCFFFFTKKGPARSSFLHFFPTAKFRRRTSESNVKWSSKSSLELLQLLLLVTSVSRSEIHSSLNRSLAFSVVMEKRREKTVMFSLYFFRKLPPCTRFRGLNFFFLSLSSFLIRAALEMMLRRFLLLIRHNF